MLDHLRVHCQVDGGSNQLAIDRSGEDIVAPVVFLELASDSSQLEIEPVDISWRGIALTGTESIEQAGDDAERASAVGQGISSAQVAERVRQPILLFLEYEIDVSLAMPVVLESTGKAELERHVEPDRLTDPAQVMNRNLAGLEEGQDTMQPPLPGLGDLEHASGLPT